MMTMPPITNRAAVGSRFGINANPSKSAKMSTNGGCIKHGCSERSPKVVRKTAFSAINRPLLKNLPATGAFDVWCTH